MGSELSLRPLLMVRSASLTLTPFLKRPFLAGWVEVTWENGITNLYRMGAENKFDLKLASERSDSGSAKDVTSSNEVRKSLMSSILKSGSQRSFKLEQVWLLSNTNLNLNLISLFEVLIEKKA